jgi:hypothetical protein
LYASIVYNVDDTISTSVPFRYDAKGEGVKILKANYGTYFGYFLITKLFDDTISTSVPFRYDAKGEGVKILKANYGTYFGYFLITKLFDDTLGVKVYIVIYRYTAINTSLSFLTSFTRYF